jgi:alpha-beta hydrolase superfamily lysophospholipase
MSYPDGVRTSQFFWFPCMLPQSSAAVVTFTASDSYVWRFRRYEPTGRPRAHVVCLHGIQSHSGWYEHSSARLCQAGYSVSFLDRRGSGMNELHRGDTPHFQRLLDDLGEFLRSPAIAGTAEPRQTPIYLLAISWGGKLALALQRAHPGLVDGLLLLCPGLFPRIRPALFTRLAILGARLVAPSRQFPIPLNVPELFTATPRWRDFIREDPLALRQATARFLVESVRLDRYLKSVARDVIVPTLLLLAGQDRIIRNDRTRTFVESFAHPDKRILTYPDAYHTLEFEPNPERFLSDMQRWLDAHSGKQAGRPL